MFFMNSNDEKKNPGETQLTINVMVLVPKFTRQVWIVLNQKASKTKRTYCKCSIVEDEMKKITAFIQGTQSL